MSRASHDSRRDARALLFAAPVVAFALVMTYLVAEAIRPGSFSAPRLRTISEAVAAGNAGQALEMMSQGASIDAVGHVREGVFEAGAYDVTPIEAAILTRRVEAVRLLIRSGADSARSKLAVCLARRRLPEALPLLGQVEPDSELPIVAPDAAIAACTAQAAQP